MYENKNILVCGMAKSGISAALFLKEKGANVTLQDLKSKEAFGDTSCIEDKGIVLYMGKNPDDIIEKQDVVVLSPGIPCDLSFVKKAYDLGKEVTGEIEVGYKFCPCPVAAITGTNGKTTTTTLTGEIFKAFCNTAVVGNIGIPFTGEVDKLDEKSYAVLEASSFQLETIKDFKAHIAAVLNITPDHLNRHKTLETYIAMKERVFENQTEEDFLVLNYEDETCRDMKNRARGRVFFFSSARELDEGIFLKDGNIIIKWDSFDETVININDIKILGTHNYENVMASVAIAVCAGIPMETIVRVVKDFKGVEHRIEYCGSPNGVDYYNDSKGTNPDASIKAVMAMVKPIVLIGGGYDKKADYTDWVKTFDGRVKHIVLIGETAGDIEKCCIENGFDAITVCDTFEEAVAECAAKAEEGDCVLLSPACASWGMFDNFEQRGDLFKELVRKM